MQSNPPKAATRPEVKEEPWRDYAAVHSQRIKDKLFPKLLTRLAAEEVSRVDMPAVIEELFSQVLVEESLLMSEGLRADILNLILAPFKPEEDKRHVRIRIRTKGAEQAAMEGSLPIVQARDILRGALDALNSGRKGEVYVLDDDQWDIRLTIEDEPKANTADSAG